MARSWPAVARGGARALVRARLERALRGRLREYPAAELAAPALVFAPHQDDETLGCGGIILRKRAAGADVGIVWLTDGATSHRRLMPEDEMRARREAEARAAAGVLGVAADRLRFLGYRNRELHAHREAAAADVARILAERRPAEVFVPYRLEAPLDHRAAREVVLAALDALAAREARWRPVTVSEYPVWFWQQWPWSRVEHYGRRGLWREMWSGWRASRHLLRDLRVAVPLDGVREAKREALVQHRSQLTRLVDDPAWRTLGDVAGGEWLERFFGDHELFHRYDARRE
jgi:LmbE family N-acetylglucosaminyl deacetylase